MNINEYYIMRFLLGNVSSRSNELQVPAVMHSLFPMHLQTQVFPRRRWNPVYARHRVLLNRRTRTQVVRHTALPAAKYTTGSDTGYSSNSITISFRPRSIHQTGVLPGDCWAFKGSSGSVVIRLLGYVYVSGFSLEHISSSISPTGETDTAPKDFSLWVSRLMNDYICACVSHNKFI